jgi:hypothetical protein
MQRLLWLAVLIIIGQDTADAAGFTSRATGNYNATATWARLRAGTITTSTASATVTGVGTAFLGDLANGNQIFTDNGVLIGTVLNRASNTSLTLTANAASTNAGVPYYATTAVAPGAADDVRINGHNVTLTAAGNALSFVVNAGGTLTTGSFALTIAAGTGVVTINGNIAGNGNAASRIVKNSTGNLSGTGTITNVNDVTIAVDTTIPIGTSLTFTGAECRLDLSANVDVINNGTVTFNTALCGTSRVINLANPSSFTNNGTVVTGSVVGANAANSIWTNAAGSTLQVTAALLATGRLNASANPNTVHYNVNAAQTIKLPFNGDYWDLEMSGGNTKTFAVGTFDILNDLTINTGVTATANTNDPIINVTRNMTVDGTYTASNQAAAPLTITGDLSIGGTFTGNTAPINLAGNFTRTGTYTTGAGVITFNGAAQQTITGATTFTNMTVNGAGLLLAANTTVSTTLTLTNGLIETTAGFAMVTTRACNAAAPVTVVRTNGWVNGSLVKTIPAGASTCAFEVGDATLYAPASLVFAAGTGAGLFGVSTTAGDHPNIGTSTLDPNFTVNRYWTFTDISVGITTYAATFTFNAADRDTDLNTAAVVVQRFTGGVWNNTTIGTRTATTTQITGLTLGGDFQIGESRPTAGSGSFNAVEVGGAILTNIRTKVAGNAFNLDIVALNAARNAINANFKGPVTVEILNSSNNAGGFDVNGCKAGWSVIQSFSTTIADSDNGRHLTSFTENNIYPDARVRVKYTINSVDLLVGCSVDNFAIRPNTFDNVTVTDLDWENPYLGVGAARSLTNTATSGGVVHKAGRSFTVSARAINGASAAMTTYAGTPVAVTTVVTPAGGANGSLTFGSWSASSGTVTSTNATFSEAGVVTMRLEDQTYANVDAADGLSTTADRYVVFPLGPNFDIGRFVPNHFTFTSPNVPSLRTFGATCVGARSFTYIGQPFWYATLPSATIEARNVANAITTNYRGTLFKLAASGIGEAYSNNATGPTLNAGSAVSPPQLATGNGTGTYTAAAAATNVNLTYARDNSTPIIPFTANISLTVTASDNSEDNGSTQGIISQAASLAYSAIAFDSGSDFRYGQIRMLNTAGPGNVDLPITLRAEYYTSVAAGFVTNTADNCTPLVAGNFKLTDHTGSLTTGNMPDTNVSVPARLTAGIATNMKLLKASVTTPGSVRICFDLDNLPAVGDTTCQAGTPANRAYMQGPWTGSTYNQDPKGQVSVGTFGAQPNNFIFFRENY